MLKSRRAQSQPETQQQALRRKSSKSVISNMRGRRRAEESLQCASDNDRCQCQCQVKRRLEEQQRGNATRTPQNTKTSETRRAHTPCSRVDLFPDTTGEKLETFLGNGVEMSQKMVVKIRLLVGLEDCSWNGVGRKWCE